VNPDDFHPGGNQDTKIALVHGSSVSIRGVKIISGRQKVGKVAFLPLVLGANSPGLSGKVRQQEGAGSGPGRKFNFRSDDGRSGFAGHCMDSMKDKGWFVVPANATTNRSPCKGRPGKKAIYPKMVIERFWRVVVPGKRIVGSFAVSMSRESGSATRWLASRSHCGLTLSNSTPCSNRSPRSGGGLRRASSSSRLPSGCNR
jgi:hypothetical protein